MRFNVIRKYKNTNMAISEHELRVMNKDLNDLHYDVGLPALKQTKNELIEAIEQAKQSVLGKSFSRRNVLIGGAMMSAGGVLLAACSSKSSNTQSMSTSTAQGAKYPANLTGDLAVAALAASLENLGVYAYNAGISAAKAGKLGTVPSAVVTFAQTAMSQHQQHGAAWNSILKSASKADVTETDPVLTPVVNQKFGQVTDVAGLAKLALDIEDIAAQTYQNAIGILSSDAAIKVAASIQPVEMQHEAILNFVLGNYPVPNAFNPTSNARGPSDLAAKG